MYRTLIVLLITPILIGCNHNKSNTIQEKHASVKNQYAENFTIKHEKDYTLLEINNPWIDAKNINYTYAIATHPKAQLPKNTIHINNIPTRVAAISTTHLAFIEALNKIESVMAISDAQYVYNKNIKTKHSKGMITEVGFETNLNIEKLLQLKTDLVFIYGISHEIEPLRKKLLKVGITPVMIGEYTEKHPLGKAEWIKVFGAIYNQNEQANQIFDSIVSEYSNLKQLAANVKNRPTVFTGLPWNETWHTPGGKSFTAQLIYDAGGTYIFATDTATINYQYDTEIVYQRAGNADFWINTGIAVSLQQIESTDKRMNLFKAFSTKTTFNNNFRSVPGGGSDYMESGAVNPHIILADLIKIFHPEIINHSLHYYQHLQ